MYRSLNQTLVFLFNRCTIAWVKAHIGTEENEAADEAAKKGAENIGNKLQLIRTPIPHAIRKEDIDKAIRFKI